MPSLENLEKFKEILLQVGKEPQINEQEGVTRDDIETPDTEPAPLPDPQTQKPEEEYQEDTDGFNIDFEDLTATPPDALTTPEVPDVQDAFPAEETSFDAGDIDLENLLKDAADATDAAGPDAATDAVGPDAAADTSGPDAADAAGPDAADAADTSGPDAADAADTSGPDAADAAGIDISDIDFSGFGEETPVAADDAAQAAAADDAAQAAAQAAAGAAAGPPDMPSDMEMPPGMDNAPDLDIPPGMETPPDLDIPPGLDNAPDLDIPPGMETPPDLDNAAALDNAADLLSALDESELRPDALEALKAETRPEPLDTAFDDFSPLEAAGDTAGTAAPADAAAGLPSLDDFGIPGLDGTEMPAPRPSAAFAPASKEASPASLSGEDLEELLRTLDSYPLALRIVCEEIIAGDAPVSGSGGEGAKAKLVTLLVNGGSPREAAELAGRITKKNIPLPKGALRKTAAELEAEQKSFKYIFVNKFLPIITLALISGILAVCASYLVYQFVYKPVRAGMLYKQGYAAIGKGQYERANQLFVDAYKMHPVKNWFYKYAEAFRDEKQYIYAERKYDELLILFPKDKKGAYDYAMMESKYVRNYEKADRVIREHILDYNANDLDGLMALGDVNLDWGDSDPEEHYSRYEEARLAYARYITVNGQSPPIMERMLKYFIRTDNLGEVIPLQKSFMNARKVPISASTLSELGGYLLDKRLEHTDGVPDAHIDEIEGIKDVLIRAVKTDDDYRKAEYKRTRRAPPPLPEPHYQLGRYYHFYNAPLEERHTLETAAAAFDAAVIENPKRARYRIDTQRMLADMMIERMEWITAEETLAKGVNIYENALERRLVKRRYADAGKLYETLGNIEYFINNRDMNNVVRYYLAAKKNEWSPPELQYRLGAAYYHLGDYLAALELFFDVSMEMPYNRRLLHALGNVSYMRNDFFTAQGYYNSLIRLLERDRLRFPVMTPEERVDHAELLWRMMTALNNMGVTLNALAARAGNPAFRAQALSCLSESERYWNLLSRDENMARPGISTAGMPGVSLPSLNIRQLLYPVPGTEPQLYNTIDKDVLEPSQWEELAAKTDIPAR